MPPEWTNLVLAAHVPHCEADVLVLNRLDVEPDGGNGLHDFPELQLVEDRGLPRRIETHHEDAHLALRKHAVDDPARELRHQPALLPVPSRGARSTSTTVHRCCAASAASKACAATLEADVAAASATVAESLAAVLAFI